MGVFDVFEGWKYGQKVEMNDFKKMLAERGLSIHDVQLPNLLNQSERNSHNPYASPGIRHRSIPDTEIYKYFRVSGDKVEYFAQHTAESKDKHGTWKPGPTFHTSIKLPKKGKSKK